MARSVLEIILTLKGDKATRELKKVDKELVKVEKSAKKSGAGIKGLSKDMLKMGAVVGGTVAGAVALGKALWALGKRGAIVEQTEESFKGLLDQWDISPEILEDMRRATRGTVDDMTLMKGTLTLVAGTTEELGQEFIKAAPRLLEISKAANKLNPALGDTAFLYDSITSGIKRNSKMILDNLGIVFSQTTAYSDYAEKIGKSVDALNDEEKALATLAIVSEDAGQNLIDQVGGNLDAVGDSIATMEVNIANLKDEMAKGFAPVVSDTAGFIAEQAKQTRIAGDALDELGNTLRENLITTEEYIELKQLFTLGLIDEEELLRQLSIRHEDYERSLGITADTTEEVRAETLRLAEKYGHLGVEINAAQVEADMLEDEYIYLADATDEAGEATEEFAKRMDRLNEQSRNAIDNLREMTQIKIDEFFDVDLGVGDVAARMFDITNFKELGGEALEIMVHEVQAGLAEGKITGDQAREFFQNIAVEAEAIKVQMGEIDASDAAESISRDFNIPIAESRELIDSVLEGVDLVNSADISDITEAFDNLQELKEKLIEAGELPIEVDPELEAQQSLEGLQDQVDFLTEEPWIMDVQVVVTDPLGILDTPFSTSAYIGKQEIKRGGGRKPGSGGQHGLDMVVPPGFPGDTYPIWTTSGEHVTVTPKGKQQGNVSYTQNIQQHFYDEGAAALGLAVVRQAGRERLNASMGR